MNFISLYNQGKFMRQKLFKNFIVDSVCCLTMDNTNFMTEVFAVKFLDI